MKGLEKVSMKIARLVEKHKPTTINEKWIRKHSKKSIEFIRKNNLDWDTVTKYFDRSLQRKWNRKVKIKNHTEYFNEFEVETLLKSHKKFLYTFIIYRNLEEFNHCDRMCILLTRLAQNGNICAREKLQNSLEEIIYKWIETDPAISRWREHENSISIVLSRCVRKYRYSGSFLGYFKRSLQLQALAFPRLEGISLNKVSGVTGMEVHETLRI